MHFFWTCTMIWYQVWKTRSLWEVFCVPTPPCAWACGLLSRCHFPLFFFKSGCARCQSSEWFWNSSPGFFEPMWQGGTFGQKACIDLEADVHQGIPSWWESLMKRPRRLDDSMTRNWHDLQAMLERVQLLISSSKNRDVHLYISAKKKRRCKDVWWGFWWKATNDMLFFLHEFKSDFSQIVT